MSEPIEPCPNCGGEANISSTFGGFVHCPGNRCFMTGPNDDPDGAKWNAMARAVREAADWRQRAEAAEANLTFAAFRRANVMRCLKWHPGGIESWSTSDWMTALVGEVGELASLLKMRNRERDGLPGNKFSPSNEMVADELADVQTYLDLLAAALGVDLGEATARKFNKVSERVGFPDRIDLPARPADGGAE